MQKYLSIAAISILVSIVVLLSPLFVLGDIAVRQIPPDGANLVPTLAHVSRGWRNHRSISKVLIKRGLQHR
jgi:hypothetical protein